MAVFSTSFALLFFFPLTFSFAALSATVPVAVVALWRQSLKTDTHCVLCVCVGGGSAVAAVVAGGNSYSRPQQFFFVSSPSLDDLVFVCTVFSKCTTTKTTSITAAMTTTTTTTVMCVCVCQPCDAKKLQVKSLAKLARTSVGSLGDLCTADLQPENLKWQPVMCVCESVCFPSSVLFHAKGVNFSTFAIYC